MHELRHKVIVITGAGQGIGQAYAMRFAQLGAAIVVNDINVDAANAVATAIKDEGGQAIANGADISDWAQAGTLIGSCIDAFGRIDGLVNNAAIFSAGRLDEYEPGSFERMLSVNVLGTINCASHALRQMRKRGTGAILNVTSGAHMGVPAMGAYGASKGAVASLTYSWAAELEASGIRVNCISPMAQTAMGDAFSVYLQSRGHAGAKCALTAASNVDVAAFLMSDDAAAIHGQIVRIEGGHLSLIAHPAVALPLMVRESGWSYEAVVDAFESDLTHRQVPVGVVGVSLGEFRPASEMWVADGAAGLEHAVSRGARK
ncbi:SDR family oxidoreductase [Novosphingobium sp. G106]|uniref:SDR family NAD(P)-dependent oxidoreductase n=1 Tax=Novosphingobium sp. G106 TaxID=2849500 RepID=UPI001C2D792C|nr:SDR family oxidoreductase [Novosphingobium sp. G106]MBV1688859.1 SDR family oxidoreductase [Novosphingobium sp. G106]